MSCTLCGSDRNLDYRGEYVLCENCAKERQECVERTRDGIVLDRNCSELCVRCGLCCVVLSAAVESHEVEKLANWSGRLPTEIAMVEKLKFQGEGNLVLKRPCVFLLGKPCEYVSCRAYNTDRPKVCGSYLCKLAIRYKAGACSLNEALFILKASTSSIGHLGMFNWSDDLSSSIDTNDSNLAKMIALKKAVESIVNGDMDDIEAKLALFSNFHPSYKFKNNVGETVFAAMSANFKGKTLALNQFFEKDKTEGWSERDKDIAMQTIYQVVGDILDHFSEV